MAFLTYKLLTLRMHVMLLHRYISNGARIMPDRLRKILLSSGTLQVECAIIVETNPALRPWAWYCGTLIHSIWPQDAFLTTSRCTASVSYMSPASHWSVCWTWTLPHWQNMEVSRPRIWTPFGFGSPLQVSLNPDRGDAKERNISQPTSAPSSKIRRGQDAFNPCLSK